MLHVFSINRVKLVAHTQTATDIKGPREYMPWFLTLHGDSNLVIKRMRATFAGTSAMQIRCTRSIYMA
jgi:hypothetical protein